MGLHSQRRRWKHPFAAAKFFVVMLLAVTIQYGCGDELETMDVTINGHVLHIEIARTDEEQAKGLMYRKTMAENHGMLFPYESDRKLDFWMKDTAIPLSIAFVAADGTIKEIYDMKPFSHKTVSSRHSVRFALEVNQGLFEKLGIVAGDRVVFPEEQ
jgi:uncharacterized membrane protein (UPF0127 family)